MDVPLPQYIYNKQHSTLLSNLRQFYSSNILCDVTICVNDVKVQCHKNVLAASSPYFCAMFTNDMSEKSQDSITLHAMDDSTFRNVIDYMYTADIHINNDNVQYIFTTASLLQMNDLLELCSSFMQKEIHVSNCVSLFQFASLHSAASLKTVSKTYLINHFKEVNNSDEFLKLQKDELIEILVDDNLNVDDECLVFNTVMNWLNMDFDHRKVHMESVLKTVRYSLIDPDLVDSLISSLGCFKNGDLLSKCLIDINKQYGETNELYRIGMFEREMIVFAGGSQTKHARSLSCYDPLTKRNYYAVQPYLSFDFKYRIDYHKIVNTNDNHVFLIGGVFYDVYHYEQIGQALSEVKVFDPHNKSWLSKADLVKPRCSHAAVTSGNYIYVFGGKSHYPKGEPLDSMEIYDIDNNRWSVGASMPEALSHHGAVLYQSSAYIVGGYKNNENDEVSNDIYQYNTDRNQWTKLEMELHIARGEFGIALLNDDIYVIAGNRGPFKVAFVEVLNLTSLRTRFVADFPEDRKSMSALVMNNKVFVCGGIRTIISRMNRGPRVVETRDLWSYDPNTDTWTKEAKLVQYANIHGCTVAKMNLRRLYESEFISSV